MVEAQNHLPELEGKIRILVVEDDPSIRTVFSALLEAEGYSVHTSENGQVALDLLKTGFRPDLILLDLMMPVMSGWELLKAKRNDPAITGIPVVVLSASTLVSGNLDGASAVYAKPIDIDFLLARLKEMTTDRRGVF